MATMSTPMSAPTAAPQIPKKRLVVCCDGTWMDSDQGIQGRSSWTETMRTALSPPIDPILKQHSNVTRIARSIKRRDTRTDAYGIPQIVYYQAGLGTRDIWDKVVGGATGLGLAENVREAYQFLASNYNADARDEIFIVGFSRGSFTARSIAAFISECGLLTPKGMQYFYPIFEDWENQIKPGYRTSFPEFPFKDRPSLSTDARKYVQRLVDLKMTIPEVEVQAVAVYDTVGSLGLPRLGIFEGPQEHRSIDYAFVDAEVPWNVKNAFHALALDEDRPPFVPTTWESPPYVPTKNSHPPVPGQVLKQCWFPGAHADVGGGYDIDFRNADITLTWMIEQLTPFLEFDMDLIRAGYAMPLGNEPVEPEDVRIRWRPYGCGKIHDPYKAFYALSGSKEQGKRTPGEYLRYDNQTGLPMAKTTYLENTREMIHASVRLRMGLGGKGQEDLGGYDSRALSGWEVRGLATQALPSMPYNPVPGAKPSPKDTAQLLNGIQQGQSQIFWTKASAGGHLTRAVSLPEAPLGPLELALLRSIQPDLAPQFLTVRPLKQPGDHSLTGMAGNAAGKAASLVGGLVNQASHHLHGGK